MSASHWLGLRTVDREPGLSAKSFLRPRAKPSRFFIAEPVGSEHGKARLGRIVQVQLACSLGRYGAEIPAWGMNADDFASGLEGTWQTRIAFFIRSAAETQEAAVGRPVHVVNVVRFIFNAQTP